VSCLHDDAGQTKGRQRFHDYSGIRIFENAHSSYARDETEGVGSRGGGSHDDLNTAERNKAAGKVRGKAELSAVFLSLTGAGFSERFIEADTRKSVTSTCDLQAVIAILPLRCCDPLYESDQFFPKKDTGAR
jgi:hypothetical protein